MILTSKRAIEQMRLLTALLCVIASHVAPAVIEIGERVPNWHIDEWVNSNPLQLGQLRGRVVLVRWWTAPDCPFCRKSAAALKHWEATYRRRGLEVVGVYHHKASSPLQPDQVREYARALGFEFPIGIDSGWRTLNDWWLSEGSRDWTSISVLIDRDGVVRHIHEGGSYEQGDDDYREIEAAIESLLAQPPSKHRVW